MEMGSLWRPELIEPDHPMSQEDNMNTSVDLPCSRMGNNIKENREKM